MRVVKVRKEHYCVKCGKEISPGTNALLVYDDGVTYPIRRYYDKVCANSLFADIFLKLNEELNVNP